MVSGIFYFSIKRPGTLKAAPRDDFSLSLTFRSTGGGKKEKKLHFKDILKLIIFSCGTGKQCTY